MMKASAARVTKKLLVLGIAPCQNSFLTGFNSGTSNFASDLNQNSRICYLFLADSNSGITCPIQVQFMQYIYFQGNRTFHHGHLALRTFGR